MWRSDELPGSVASRHLGKQNRGIGRPPIIAAFENATRYEVVRLANHCLSGPEDQMSVLRTMTREIAEHLAPQLDRAIEQYIAAQDEVIFASEHGWFTQVIDTIEIGRAACRGGECQYG